MFATDPRYVLSDESRRSYAGFLKSPFAEAPR